jgi:ribosomal protein L29
MWTPIREKGKTGEKPNTAVLEEPSHHKAEMAKMTDEQLKTHLRDLREKYHSAVQQREQPRYASPRMLLGPTYNIEAQAALERAEEEASSRHKAEMAKMTDEQLKTHLRELREKYQSAGQQREQARDALLKTSRGPIVGSMPSWEVETDQAIRYIEGQAALEWATKEEDAIKPALNEAASAYKERLLSQFKASQHLPAN